MKKTVQYLLWLGLAPLWLACSSNKVEVRNRNFAEEIAQQQNLIFTFNHDLVADSLVGRWDSAAYVAFEPAVRGKFKWTAANELMFSPDLGFRPSTDYRARLTEDVLRHAATTGEKKSLSLAEESGFAFHTPYLDLVNTDMFWSKSAAGVIELHFNLNFNYKVNPAEVGSRLTVQIGGKNVTARVTNTNVSDKVAISVTQPSGAPFDGKPVVVSVKEGLKCAESTYATPKLLTLQATVPDKDHFQIVQVEPEFQGETGQIRVHTNQAIESKAIAKFIQVTPAADIRVEPQEYGFLIKGDFKPGSYDLRISKELRGIFGALADDYTQVVVFGDMKPSIAFANREAIYLTSKGSRNLGVRIINVPKVKVAIYKIYDNNILSFLRNNGASEYYYDEGSENEYYMPAGDDNPYGRVISEREIETKNLSKAGDVALLDVNLPENDQFKGIYLLKVTSANEQYLSATQLVSISDLGFMVRETPSEVVVFCNSILSAQPLQGVKVNLVSSNNQNVYTAETDGSGVARFPDLDKKAPGFKIAMVTGQQGEDFNYLLFAQTAVENSRYDVGGARENASGYQAFLYGDRDIYRPGETVYLNTVVRNAKWETAGEFPVKLKVVSPNGKEFALLKGNLSEQGAFATSLPLPQEAVTGTYNVEVYTANDVLLVNRSISVEEFIPDRIKVSVKLSREALRVGEALITDATAVNLFGPPAAGRNYEVSFGLKRKDFAPAQFAGYNFYTARDKNIVFEQDVRQGTTDADGQLSESFSVPTDFKDAGVLAGTVHTTVFDETGRPVNRMNRFDVFTQDVFYGIRLNDTYVNTREALQIPLVAVDRGGKALSGIAARVQIVKLNWETVLVKSQYGDYRYDSQKKEQVLADKTITLNGTGTSYAFVPNLSGEYEIRVSRPGAATYVASSFYAYGWGFTQNTSFEVNREGQIEIETDKKTYQVGDKAEVLLKTPFAGKVLITVERNKVFEHFYQDTDKKSARITIPIKEEYLPNAYITATLIKPVDNGAMPLTVAHGFAPIGVEQEGHKLPVEIVAAAGSRSRTKQTVTVKTKPGAEVTVAVIDEGILQLKNFQTPDPFAFFFQKRALEVNAYDLYPKLFPELNGTLSSTGGDGYNLEKRVNPLTNKRVKLVAFWSGPLQANGDGEVTYTVDVPQFSGDLRIMAVAYKGNAFGSGSANMKVADPVVISASLPRFLSPGDQLEMPVTLTNTTKGNTTATVRLKTTGAVGVAGESEKTVELPAGREAQVQFAVNAQDAIGTGQVTVEVSALGSKFTDLTDITVRPITSLLKKSGSGVAGAGTATSVSLATDFIPATTQARFLLSRSPLVQFAGDLDYLLEYPYGCVEQTTSTAFPQLYFAELSQAVNQRAAQGETDNANYNVQQAIRKLQSMQLHNGALSYWPEGGYESWWGTAYATHFLLEARKAGFQVNGNVLERLLGYLGSQVKKKESEEYFYYTATNARESKRIAPKEVAYSLYVLALGGRQDVATMNYYKGKKSQLAIDSKYLLAATYQLLGDNASFRTVVPSAFAGERSVSAFGGSFYSYVRDQAIALNALLEADPQHPQVPVMAKHLSEQMKQKSYLNTQERSFGLLALGKLARKTNAGTATAQVKAGGAVLGTLDKGDLVLKGSQIVNKNLTVQTEGNGGLYYFWQAEGLSTSTTVTEEDSYLRVRKTFFDRFGNPLAGNTFKQNDLVVIRITLATTDGSDVENVVITDMLPAGFEIENPRISEMAEMTWAEKAARPEHFDVRDDRINLFATATDTPRSYYYVVRAVSTGTFRMGPVSADAMYNGDYHSIHGAGTIRVTGKESKEAPPENVGE
ncbi:MAG: Alpha-2-macroglobulin [uncultured Cytophagales bacterium]|uniref:Alpha-2-macroglobulin n=1 Tax=uncultured Cytophagales bacterium TaxID=158755 RepID=A0A6J4IXV7_9SPHI|nr:MAG: Alpha-2-macroglobulin [uncultured Cytophagales bacterium]